MAGAPDRKASELTSGVNSRASNPRQCRGLTGIEARGGS